MISVKIDDGYGSNGFVKVNPNGQLVVGPLAFDETSFQEMNVIDTAFNFYGPVAGKQFVITNVIAFASKDVTNNTDTVIDIYEASADDTATADKTLLEFGMGQLANASFGPLNIIVNKGKWINGKTSDNTIWLNILGYYIDEL